MFKRLFCTFCLAAVLLLTGCTSKFAYNNIDWLLYWYVDDYVDLDKSQKQMLDAKVEKWLLWHRQDELLRYRQHLEDLKTDIQNGVLSSQQWLTHFDRGSAHWKRFRGEISPELSELSLHLNDQQIDDMFAALEKDNLKQEKKRNKMSKQQRIEDSIENTQEQIKEWLGKLSNPQKVLISEYVSDFKPTFEYWMSYRREIQNVTKTLMLSRHQVDDYASKLNQLMQNPDQFKSSEYLQANEYNRIKYANLLNALNMTLTEKQKKHMKNKLNDLIEDIDDLIQD
ncbi:MULTISPECIES: DUF6279 family lipoprotein [Alteromonadaceae]|uniref:DUF6279 family lipoprotein n=1 Tax=Alteromonadaceae TaxID=72275 RepID=UPI001C08EAFB|nr:MULTISPECIES: DUF6279 family lipoprotein [Aliiglaciecola]MBU2877363.1 hypothetical protein [Aliiglaciecola lipolytica]MDO6713011.1 DUF6279 family lipoprotein [Aliiglaciecola sp. 2_MG-2023]MDO6754050.1 DUF6279 family lipoprotein [Aliiglaciecola sp. 1_MG-2023]